MKPRTVKQLQKLLGFINWFRNYIPGLSVQLAKITDKTKKDRKFVWTEEDTLIIEKIFEQLSEKSILNYPDFEKSFDIFCDASDKGMGSILRQKEKIIGYFSYKFNSSELNYSVMEKEAFAIIKSINHFKNLIFASKINIYSDNSNILFDSQKESKRIKRWKYLLNEFDFELHHIKGKKNTGADFLSRIYSMKDTSLLNEIYNLEKLVEQQNSDENIITKTERGEFKRRKIESFDVVCDKNLRIIIPEKYFVDIFDKLHEMLGHPGSTKFYGTL